MANLNIAIVVETPPRKGYLEDDVPWDMDDAWNHCVANLLKFKVDSSKLNALACTGVTNTLELLELTDNYISCL